MTLVKIAITTAEAKLQSASLPTASVTPATTQYTSEQFQQLSAKGEPLTVELSTVRGEREALQAGAAAPAVSTEDILTVGPRHSSIPILLRDGKKKSTSVV